MVRFFTHTHIFFFDTSIYEEAAIGGVAWKNMFLKISQILQENTCARVSLLIKLQAWGLQLY